MSARYAALAARLFARPLLAEPWAAACVLGVLADRLGIEVIGALDPKSGEFDEFEASFLAGEAQHRARSERREYAVTDDGIAMIPVFGSLVSRSSSLQPMSGATGYSAIESAFGNAMADPDVRGILAEIDSPGGEAAGALEASRFIASLRGEKPMWTLANSQAASAAYAIASATDRIVTSRGGDIGSIGVLGIHVDQSGELSKRGRKVTVIQKGARKAEGHPFAPLEAEALAAIEGRLGAMYDEFVGLVAMNRGLGNGDVRLTEGATFDGPEALRLGLVDAVMDPREAMAEFREFLNRGDGRRSAKEQGMEAPATTGAAAAVPGLYTQADLDRSNADTAQRVRSEVLSAERSRWMAVLDHEEAAGARQPAARHLLGNTGMEASDVVAALAVMPKVEAKVEEPTTVIVERAATDFNKEMAKVRNPQVGPDSGEMDETEAFLLRARQRDGRAI